MTADPIVEIGADFGDRYLIERELGRGGMAVVYLARDRKHERPVALKVLQPELCHSLQSERFLREIKLAASLTHPHIVPVYDSGSHDGQLYYVMAYIEGESLRARLNREGRLPLEEALKIAREVADALDYAHTRGVIHRDIKPENVLLGSGHALVADFGIARAISEAEASEATAGHILGTPDYMSPEQISRDVELDGRTDIYSLGCLLFEALAGKPPFGGLTVRSVMLRRLVDPAPSLRSIDGRIPPAIDAAVSRALETEPRDRFASAAEFGAALQPGAILAAPQATRASSAKQETAPEASVAVLPFANLSSDPETEYFSDGMTEEIINALSQVPTLRVAARTSAFAFKGKSVDAREIGERLRVRTLLEGSVRKAGDQVRVTAQLINAADGYHLWSQSYDRKLADVFAVQDELARAISRHPHPHRLHRHAASVGRTADSEAGGVQPLLERPARVGSGDAPGVCAGAHLLPASAGDRSRLCPRPRLAGVRLCDARLRRVWCAPVGAGDSAGTGRRAQGRRAGRHVAGRAYDPRDRGDTLRLGLGARTAGVRSGDGARLQWSGPALVRLVPLRHGSRRGSPAGDPPGSGDRSAFGHDTGQRRPVPALRATLR